MPFMNLKDVNFGELFDNFGPKAAAQAQLAGASVANKQLETEQLRRQMAAAEAAAENQRRINSLVQMPNVTIPNNPMDVMPNGPQQPPPGMSGLLPTRQVPLDVSNPAEGEMWKAKQEQASRDFLTSARLAKSATDYATGIPAIRARDDTYWRGLPSDQLSQQNLNFQTGHKIEPVQANAGSYKDDGTMMAALNNYNTRVSRGEKLSEAESQDAVGLFELAASKNLVTPNLSPLATRLDAEKRIGGYRPPEAGATDPTAPAAAAAPGATAAPAQAASPLPASTPGVVAAPTTPSPLPATAVGGTLPAPAPTGAPGAPAPVPAPVPTGTTTTGAAPAPMTIKDHLDGIDAAIAAGKSPLPMTPSGGGDPVKTFMFGASPQAKLVADIRDKAMINPAIKEYLASQPMWDQAIKNFGKNTGPADVAIIYALAKILDPNSVVREGELLLFNSSSSVGQRMGGLYEQMKHGTSRLPPDTRLKLYDMGKEVMDARYATAAPYQRVYETDAIQRRIDPRNVLPALREPGAIKPEQISKQEVNMPGSTAQDQLNARRAARGGAPAGAPPAPGTPAARQPGAAPRAGVPRYRLGPNGEVVEVAQ